MSDVERVRLLIGDKDGHFSDDDLEQFLAMDADPRGAAATALESWAATLAAAASDVQLGDYRQMDYHKAREMRELAKSIRATIATDPEFAVSGVPGLVNRPSLLERVRHRWPS